MTRLPVHPLRSGICLAVLTLAALGLWAGPAAAQTIITTNVSSNTTWSTAGSPYILEAGTIKVLSGVTLTIEPGVTVEMNPSHAKYQGVLSVSGTVRAIGTAASPITFTSAQGAGGVGAPGQWGNVNIVSGNASSQFSYVDFFDGGGGTGPCFGYGALAVGSGSTVSVDHSVFELNASSGLHVASALANVSYSVFAHNCVGLSGGETMNVSHSTISYNNLEGANGDDGVFINGFKAGSAASTFTENTIRANGRHGIEVSGGCTYELSLYPHGERNNIYENNPSSVTENQLALTPNVTPCKPPLAVNWNNNYWGPEAYYETNPKGCEGTATPYKGHLAYAWYELGNPWDEQHGPINGGTASYHPESGIFVCGWDNFLVEELLKEPVANGAPALPELTESELRGGFSESAPNLTECYRGDPVNCATGKLVETQRDLYVPGLNGGLTFTRTYNSQAAVEASSPGPFGYGWSFGFGAGLSVDPTTHVATVTNANGSTAVFTPTGGGAYSTPPWVEARLVLNGEGNYIYTLPDQQVLTFNSSGQLQKLVDRNGNTTTLAYGAGHLETITDPGGRKLTLAYNSEGLVESVKGPMGHTVKYGYESGKLHSVTEPGEASARWQFKYDSSHQLTEMTDGRAGKTTNEYDSLHRVIAQKDPLGRKTTWVYRLGDTKVTDPTGSVTDITFAGDLPTSVTAGAGTTRATTRRYTYNAADAPLTTVNGNGRVTSYTYDNEGNRTSLIDPDAHETTWTYNTTHDVISVTTPKGETTTIKRDSHGNAESVSRPAPASKTQTTKYKYDSHGNLESLTDPLERTWKYASDSYGDRTSETDPEGDTRSWGYDEDSQQTTTVSPNGHAEGAEESKYTTTTERDPQGRPLTVTDPLGHTTKYAYDANGNLETLTDPMGNKTTYTYDADNEPTKVAEPNATITETGYDGAGRVTSQTDGNKHTTKYVRNVLGQVTEVSDPLSHKTVKTYDGAGNLKTLVDPAKRTTTYTYDLANQLKEVSYSDGKTPTVKYEYDADGERTSMTDGTGKTTYTYDQLDRLTESKDGHGDLTSYEYDLANQQTKITYPNTKAVTRAYDNAGRLKSVTDWLETTTKFAYDHDSNQTTTTFPEATTNKDTYAFDYADHLGESKMARGAETLASLTYTRNKDGNVTEATSTGLPGEAKPAYAYDANSRLTEGAAVAYKYDAANNPTKIGAGTYTYNVASQVETGPSLTYTYDELGERTKTTPSSGPATTYGYDQAGNLTTVTRPKEGETPAIEDTYAYNGDGLRTSQTVSATTAYLAWDPAEALPLLLNDGVNSYVYGPGGAPVEQISTEGAPVYLHHDQQASTRLLTGATGAVEGAYTFDAYGNQTGHTGTASTPLGYDAQYANSDTGLIYVRARTYDPKTAQFLTVDPRAAITREPYGYVNQNPVNRADPTGLELVDDLGNFVAGAGNTFTGGVSTKLLDAIGLAPDTCSTAYQLGGIAGYAGFVVPGVGEEELAARALDASGVGAEAAATEGAAGVAGWGTFLNDVVAGTGHQYFYIGTSALAVVGGLGGVGYLIYEKVK